MKDGLISLGRLEVESFQDNSLFLEIKNGDVVSSVGLSHGETRAFLDWIKEMTP